jgi:ribosomal protein S18 acetylase RimI-like enzyme
MIVPHALIAGPDQRPGFEPRTHRRPVTTFRPYRNYDSPALATVWNRGAAASSVARPLSVHELDAHAFGGPCFDAAGLIVAERDGTIVGFAHAGFGPELPSGPPCRLSHAMGTVGMIVLDPSADEPGLAGRLLAEAERYLRDRGASVLYAGGRYPLNPFYWGIYGGSEWAGILGADSLFRDTVEAGGYQPVGNTLLLEADLSRPDPRDPRAVLIRRLTRIEVEEDALPRNWWDSLALGEFRPTVYRLIARIDQTELASATTWDMSWFGRIDNRSRVGLIDVEVHPGQRRKGFGRYLVQEILKQAREQATAAVAVQTAETNIPALALYTAAGFEPVETATLYRLPGGRPDPSG